MQQIAESVPERKIVFRDRDMSISDVFSIYSSSEFIKNLGGATVAGGLAAIAGGLLSLIASMMSSRSSQEIYRRERIIRSARETLTNGVLKKLGGHQGKNTEAASITVGGDIIFQNDQRQQGAEASSVEELVNGYHAQALSQARVQFWFSVAAATVGFAWILYAAADIRPENLATVAKTLPGIAMDAVAFLFFRQASETRERATELYDRLRTDKLSAGAILLADSIDDSNVRSIVKAQMALHMSGIKQEPTDLAPLLSQTPRETHQQPS